MTSPVSPDAWTPEVWSHAAVLDMADRLDPALMTRYADEWGREIDRVAAVFADMDRQLAARLPEAWRGAGADASLAAVQRYVAGSLDGLGRCRSVGDRLAQLSHAAEELRAAITAPSNDDTAAQRHMVALQQVHRLYSHPAVAAGNAVEDIPPPPDPFSPPSGTAFGPLPTADAALADLPAGVAPQGFSPSGPPPNGSAVPARPADPPAPSYSAGLGIPPHLSNFPSSPLGALPGLERPPPAAGFDAAPTVVASPSGAPAPAPPVAAGSGRPAPPLLPYLGPLHPGYGGRDGGGERPVAGYLITIDNGSELIGPLPKVAPPVIGE